MLMTSSETTSDRYVKYLWPLVHNRPHACTRCCSQFVCSDSGSVEDAQFSAVELSQLATGMWLATAPVRASLAVGVAADAAMRTHELTAPQLVEIISGVAVCGMLDKSLMNKAARVLARDVSSLTPDQLCDVACAYARTGTSSPELFANLTGAVHMRLEQGVLEAAQATGLAWAFAIHGTSSATTIAHLFNAVVVRTMPPQALKCLIDLVKHLKIIS
jgi:hypothetical protein